MGREANEDVRDLRPHQERLAHYLDEMTAIVAERGGTVDKFIGDAIMAFWGAVYLLDAVAEVALVIAWGVAARSERRLCRRIPVPGEASEGAATAPSD